MKQILGGITMTNLESILTEGNFKKVEDLNHPLGNSGDYEAYPHHEEEIINLLKYSEEMNKRIILSGGGTKRGFGGLEEKGDILINLSNYKGIVEHSVGDMTLTVKAGTTLSDIQEYLAKHRQMVPLDTSWPEYSTIGGVISANDSGPKRLRYGSARDLVIGLKVIYPDGKIIRTGGKVVKNVAGYDMNKLFIGAMGTLGVVSEITLKLRPMPKYESMVIVSFAENDYQSLRNLAIKILDSYLEPIALELVNTTLSKKIFGQSRDYLMIGFEDVEKSVHYQEEWVKDNLPQDAECKVYHSEQAKPIWDDFKKVAPNGRAGIEETVGIEAGLKISTKSLNVIPLMEALTKLEEKFGVEAVVHGGVGHGITRVYLQGSKGAVKQAIIYINEIIENIRGYVVATHLPFFLRKEIKVWGEKPNHFFLLEGIKNKIDPNRTLNNTRFVGGI